MRTPFPIFVITTRNGDFGYSRVGSGFFVTSRQTKHYYARRIRKRRKPSRFTLWSSNAFEWWLTCDFSRSIGVHPSPGPPSPWWYHRAFPQGPRLQVQLREVHLPQVLRTLLPRVIRARSNILELPLQGALRQHILTLTRLVSLPVPPTAVRRSAATPTSSAPRRSSNKRLAPRCCARCAVVQNPVQGNGWAATWRGLQMALDMMKQSMQPQSYCS
jgi:hypothetical protein